MLQERPLSRPESGFLSNRNELSKDIHVLAKQETLLGRGAPGGEQEGQGTQENSWATWLAVCSMVMGLVSGLSLANHSDSESFLVAHASQNGC